MRSLSAGVNEEQSFCYGGMKLALDEAIDGVEAALLEKVFPTRSDR